MIVFLPGFGGSVLVHGERRLWGLGPRALTAAAMGSLAVGGAVTAAADQGGVRAEGVLHTAAVLPGVTAIDLYGAFARRLCSRLGLRPEENYREFPYDWRLDNRISARALERQATQWLAEWRAMSNNPSAQLVLIGHSMGGLVARYAVEVLGLWRISHAVITLGTPHRGAPKSALTLAGGLPRLGLLGTRLVESLRSMQSVYQLLPLYPCVHLPGSPAPQRITECAPALGLDPGRVRDGAEFLREIHRAASRNAGDPDYTERGVLQHAVVGIHQRTAGLLAPGTDGARLGVTGKRAHPANLGDGTVPEPSAYPIEWDHPGPVAHVVARHSTLPASRAVINAVAGWLRAVADPARLSGYRAPGAGLALWCPDAVMADVPFDVTVASIGSAAVPPSLSVSHADDGQAALASAPMTALDDGRHRLRIVLTRPGCHRVQATARDGSAEPLSDVILVVPADGGR
ncbi:hypothetical protein N4P33_02685 [Streptomyces sp. 15-116A]|uniref:lipase/acyltransferase domain-containing protein n=1 Tax=Streptomyces sp. 15-116A TaxID=2259035 RepID=UPI0021B17600|nr:hypothetical protein [Streptomyces sp. 15-116A]MCT7351086.1 hypothetical protein [Streptomyces sp. 15-116A]